MAGVHRIVLGGIQIDGTDGAVTLADVVGWDGVPDVRGQGDPIPQAHGLFQRVEVWRTSRAVTISGMLHSDDRAGAEALRSRLSAAWESAREISVHDLTGVWTTAAEVDRVDFPDLGAWSPHIPFTIDLVAPDPVRYRDVLTVGPVGVPVQVGGLILPSAFPWDFGTSTRPVAVVVNDGKLPVLPRMILSGSADGVTVHGGPWRLEYGAFSGELIFDSTERRAWLNGTDVTRHLIRRDWPVVEPGVSSDFYFTADVPSAETTLTVEYRIGVW